MQLNQEQLTFLKAVIDGEFSNNIIFKGTIEEISRADYIAQLAPDLYSTYLGLDATGHLDSHPEASFYLALASIVEGQPGVEEPVWLWLRGAAEVNIGVGSQADFIRNYNNAQADARTGGAVTVEKMNEISNTMARIVYNQLSDPTQTSSEVPPHTVPDIKTLASVDAAAAAAVLFGGELGGWAGNPLFLALGYEREFLQNILHIDFDIDGNLISKPFDASYKNGTYDALAMIKFMFENYTAANIWDAISQIVSYPSGAGTAASAAGKLAAFLEIAYGIDGTTLLGYAAGSGEIQVGRLDQSDNLSTTENSDIIHTSAGDDYINAGFGSNYAGSGQQSIDLIDGGIGNDTVSFLNDIASSQIDATRVNVGSLESPGVPFAAVVTYGEAGEPFSESAALYDIENLILGQSDDHVSFVGDTSLTEIDAGGNSDDVGDTLDFSQLTKRVEIDLSTNQLTYGDNTLIATDFENVIGSDFDDTITGNDQNNILKGADGADELLGLGGDDTLYIDANDTVVDGGEGRDIAIVVGVGGVTLNLEVANIEIAIGGDGVDTFNNIDSGNMVAGGAGGDTFDIGFVTGNGPAIVFGGEGADVFNVTGGILVANVEDLTEENFASFDLGLLGLGSDFNWAAIDAVVLNPDEDDTFVRDGDYGGTIDVRMEQYSIQHYEYSEAVDPSVGGPTSPPPIVEFGSFDTLLDVTGEGTDSTGPYSTGFPQYDKVRAAGIFDATFLGSQITNIQTSVSIGYWEKFFEYDENGNLLFTDGYDFSSAVLNSSYEARYVGFDGDPSVYVRNAEIYFWMDIGGYNSLAEHPGFEDESEVSWFVAGGYFEGTTLISDGSINAVMPDPNPPEVIEDHTELDFTPGSGNKSFSGFQVASHVITVSGVALDPNAPPSGTTVSQQSNNVVITFGNDEAVTLLNVSLVEWQAAASTQVLGTAADETLTGTDGGEVLAGGAGNDVIDAGKGNDVLIGGSGNDTIKAGDGDDVIIYHSGDDVILGNWSNFGADTLDLSKYNADQVSFRITGKYKNNVIISTPDGQITLDNQFFTEALGHIRTNITTILFADGTLDEAGIRDRARNDSATDGDDVIQGSNYSEVLGGGAGNDTIYAGAGDDTIVYHSGNDFIVGYFSNNGADTLDLSKYSSDQVSFGLTGFQNRSVLISTPDGEITLGDQLLYEALGQERTNITTILFSDGTLDEAGIRDRAVSDSVTDGDDTIQGTNYAETINGGAGNDTISAGEGDDIIVYESGNDVILGNWSNYGADTLDLSKYNADQVSFRITGKYKNNVIISTPDGQITLDNQFFTEALGHIRTNITTILFADGTLDEAGIRDRARNDSSTDGDDVIQGSNYSEVLGGGAGNDTIYAGAGDDTIVYHSGNDFIVGYFSNNGADTLDLSKYSSDQVSFGLTGFQNRSVLISTPDGEITLGDQLLYEALGQERTNITTILFSDGTLDEAGIRDRAVNDAATNGDDVILGSKFGDIIDGGLGDDTITGGAGADQFVFNLSDGNDHITDFEDGIDLLRFEGTGLQFSDLVITDGLDGAVIDVAGQGTVTLTGINAGLLAQDDFLFA